MKALLLHSLIALVAALPAGPPRDLLSPDRGPPTETVRGFITCDTNIWQQWPGAAPKVFDLIDSVVTPTKSDKLAYTTQAMYRELERNTGNLVELQVIRAERETCTWLIVTRVEAVP